MINNFIVYSRCALYKGFEYIYIYILIACRGCSNYIFILDLTPGLRGLGEDNCKKRREIFKLWDLVGLYITGLTVYTPLP